MKLEFNSSRELKATARARLPRKVIGGTSCPVGVVGINTKIGEVKVVAVPVTAGAGAKGPHSKFSFRVNGEKCSAKKIDELLA